MDTERRERFRKHFEPWVLAVIFGKISSESAEAAAFLRVNSGETPPKTEVEHLWLEYWEGDVPPVATMQEIYLECAISSQSPGTAYEDIVHAYRLAALCGSYQANCWLKEQKMCPLRINSIWKIWGKRLWDVNGLKF